MRLRFFNFQDVIAEQVPLHHYGLFPYLIYIWQCLLFYKEGNEKMSGTLAFKKKDAYVVLKIFKKCTDAAITSFKVKSNIIII